MDIFLAVPLFITFIFYMMYIIRKLVFERKVYLRNESTYTNKTVI